MMYVTTLIWSVDNDTMNTARFLALYLGRTELIQMIMIATILGRFPLTEEATGTEAISNWKRLKYNRDTWKHYEIQYQRVSKHMQPLDQFI